MPGLQAVVCEKTALAAFNAIVAEGEGAPEDSANSHFSRFLAIREDYERLLAINPQFRPAHQAAENPALQTSPSSAGIVVLEDLSAIATVDLANAVYDLLLRLLAHAYSIPTGPEKSLCIDLAMGLMRAMTWLGERAARLPAGLPYPGINAGVSFAAFRDQAAVARGPSAWRLFNERLQALHHAAAGLECRDDERCSKATRVIAALAERSASFSPVEIETTPPADSPVTLIPDDAPQRNRDAIEAVEGRSLTLIYEGRRCIHARFCVTGGPRVFVAHANGSWLHPDAMAAESVIEIAHACPSGAIRYKRTDGGPQESHPPVNLISIREAGPYAVRAEIILDGEPAGTRATLCRCGASKRKPFCDNSHRKINFNASGEPPSAATERLAVRDGPLRFDPEPDGPLLVRGNMEILSGTGRVIVCATSTRLCRCGASKTKPFCDNSHVDIGFRAD